MTDPALIERITRSLAFMLRHQPETFDLELDPFGYADLEDVVQALNERLGEPVEEEDVRDAVSAGDRPRYEIQEDRIRALYGHSIPVEPGPSSKPPEFLFVAVPEQELERARRFGLRGGRRRFLHLAITKEDAAESGRRASHDYTVLVIHALDAWEEGISFYDRVALWLAEEVPTHLLEVEGTYHDGTDPVRRFDGPQESGGRERERGPERHGRSRGGRGRGRDRHHGQREERGSERHGAPGRVPAREGERVPFSAGPSADGRGRGQGGGPGRGHEREPRREPERSAQGARESSGASSAPQGERDGRGGERRNERRDERRPDRLEERPRERAPERGPERPPEPRREESRGEPRGPAREPAHELPVRQASEAPRQGRGGFGAGLDSHEEKRGREERSAPPPRPTPPPSRESRAPADNDRPGFGAGL